MDFFWLVSLLHFLAISVNGQFYNVDDSEGLGRRFDGIGGLSGGSATSKLLIGYPEKQRNEVLDFLFKPKFGASLHILKVEIGGDVPASDATEPSHMHTPWDENYDRGYEWWMMKEAKKRNPNIKLYGLPWGFPGWLGQGTQNPYINRTILADYVIKWIEGAKHQHNLTIDYIGIWNERTCDNSYVILLRQMLDERGFTNTRIVAGDAVWDEFPQVYANSSVIAASAVLGTHYEGMKTPVELMKLGKTIWCSEDFSTRNDNLGGGCWAAILNRNYVTSMITGTIAWNLIDSFFQGLPYDRDSLMTAREPWSGNYIVESPIWTTAHTTQLSEIGWHYLPHNHGVGKLQKGGSYVTLVSPDLKDLTIVIETMGYNFTNCITFYYKREPESYPQKAMFMLDGSFSGISQLNVWRTRLFSSSSINSTYFEKLEPIKVVKGAFTLDLGVNEVYSLTTLEDAVHGVYETPPPSAPFQLPYSDDFESYSLYSEPLMFAPSQGSFEVALSGDQHQQVLRQTVLQIPVVYLMSTLNYNSSLVVLGRINWTDVMVQVDARIGAVNGSNGFFVALRVDQGGAFAFKAQGIFFFIFPKNSTFLVSTDIFGRKVLASGKNADAIHEGWNHVTLFVQGEIAMGSCNGVPLYRGQVPPTPANGFVALGTDIYGIADFDNIDVTNNTATHNEHGENKYDSHDPQAKALHFLSEFDTWNESS